MIEWIKWNYDYYGRKFKRYRRNKGGTWYRCFPEMYPYMSFWLQTSDCLGNMIVVDIEEYGVYEYAAITISERFTK